MVWDHIIFPFVQKKRWEIAISYTLAQTSNHIAVSINKSIQVSHWVKGCGIAIVVDRILICVFIDGQGREDFFSRIHIFWNSLKIKQGVNAWGVKQCLKAWVVSAR